MPIVLPGPSRIVLPVAALLLVAASLAAQSGVPAPLQPLKHHDPAILAAIQATEDAKVVTPGGVAISPDGSHLAYTLSGESGGLRVVALADLDPAKEKIVTPTSQTGCANTHPVWSPDSATLAYTSTCTGTAASSAAAGPGKDSAQPQIFLWSRATGQSRQLTHLSGIFQQAAWSPDGKALAFLFVENATRSAGALAAMKPWSGVIGEDGIEIQRVAAVDIATGTLVQITPPNLHVFEFQASPLGGQIVYTAATPPGENNWWVANLYTQRHGEAPRVLVDPAKLTGTLHGLQMAVPRFSPDATQVAFIGGLMSDQGSTGGDIWVVPTAGGDPVDITPKIEGTPTYIAWTGPGNIGFVENRRGHTLLADTVVSTRTRDAEHDLGLVSLSGGPIKDAIAVSTTGTLAFVASGPATPPEVWAGAFDAPHPITHLNAAAKPLAGKTDSIEWNSDSFHVQGWLTYPASYDPARKYPLIVSVHGGPSADAGAEWNTAATASLAGFFVLQPNPRGSFGQGEAFTAANVKDFGYGDLRDILAGVDAAEKLASIDPRREGLTGWSYGGFMTMFAVTQTHRFRAAVAGAGIADWLSYYGENSIDQWMTPFFGATAYDDPAVYARASAITYIKNARTPTLVLVGDRDGECPAPQSFEFWHALRAQGTPTQLVVYPNEGHGFTDPAHKRDREERILTWFQTQMSPE